MGKLVSKDSLNSIVVGHGSSIIETCSKVATKAFKRLLPTKSVVKSNAFGAWVRNLPGHVRVYPVHKIAAITHRGIPLEHGHLWLLTTDGFAWTQPDYPCCNLHELSCESSNIGIMHINNSIMHSNNSLLKIPVKNISQYSKPTTIYESW